MNLVKQELDTNDGDYVYGFAIMTDSEYNQLLIDIEEYFGDDTEFGLYVAGNMFYVERGNFLSSYTVTKITQHEADGIERLFGKRYGDFFDLGE